MVVDIGGFRQGVSELLQAVCVKPLDICCSFASILNLNFWVPQFGGRGSLWWWALVVSDIASVSCHRASKVYVAVLQQF